MIGYSSIKYLPIPGFSRLLGLAGLPEYKNCKILKEDRKILKIPLGLY
jgi:hypothetical protein